jgi:hypothetical protein
VVTIYGDLINFIICEEMDHYLPLFLIMRSYPAFIPVNSEEHGRISSVKIRHCHFMIAFAYPLLAISLFYSSLSRTFPASVVTTDSLKDDTTRLCSIVVYHTDPITSTSTDFVVHMV